ncbi:PREDICTED: DNA-directed RNA polymerase I subunit rpa49 [Ipomoea nil]|uniref:DNA-directed RNA polymerase I subunit rpa49 n=1 Tax=Ipomoea nil TaxID=35883 RepID=UPI000900CA0C|nr:PREDICTED: DNA-directed RNA polymerase I subunit rpa49 [Ipomoea nil]XP_019193262.1 PREDICTED: DNA-directed RNA polymerase I subunit rpa49 [Ipomoea nil]
MERKEKKKKLDVENPIPYEEAENEKQKGEEETLTVKMQTLSSDPDKISPIVGYFASGSDPFTKNSAEQSDATVRVYRHTKRSNRLQLAVSQNDSPVDFVGTNYSGEATAPQLCNYAIGVLDKETQTLKIVPIAGNKVIRLDPKVAGVDIPEDENMDKKQLTAEEKALKTRALTEMYSNKKSIRKAKKLDTLREQANAGAEHVEGNELINQEALNVAIATATDGGGRNIPPHDLDATTPQAAYPLDKIIAKGEWDYLSDIFDVLETGERIPLDAFPSFVCNRTYKLADIKDETQKRRMAGIFSYITHLVKFKDKHSMDGFSSAKHHKIPGMLVQKFSSLFGVSESKRLPAEKIDLLISYVLVLTLYADNFRSDPSDIAKDLRMSAGDLRPRLELLGCKFVKEKRAFLATLPVPLKFTTKRKRRK